MRIQLTYVHNLVSYLDEIGLVTTESISIIDILTF